MWRAKLLVIDLFMMSRSEVFLVRVKFGSFLLN